jgi:hypothetical protein
LAFFYCLLKVNSGRVKMHRRIEMKFELCDVIFNFVEVENLEIRFFDKEKQCIIGWVQGDKLMNGFAYDIEAEFGYWRMNRPAKKASLNLEKIHSLLK